MMQPPHSYILALPAAVLIAAAVSVAHPPSELERPYVRAVSMEKDLRVSPEEFARRAGMDVAAFRARYGASGLIRCGEATGTGQLTLTDDVITTAGHVFFAKGGTLRSSSCFFEPVSEPGKQIAIEMDSIVSGSSDPMTERATLDWAAARLIAPVVGAHPYMPVTKLDVPSPVFMFGGGKGKASVMAAERCSSRRVTAVAPEGVREFSFDCSAEHGGSGSAILNERDEAVGIFVGYRSVDSSKAMPYSDLHYNFAITIDGPFRDALDRLARGAGNPAIVQSQAEAHK